MNTLASLAAALFTTMACTSLLADPIPVEYDTIYSYETAGGGVPTGEYVALAVSNFGEIGQAGAGGVNVDFTASGTECGDRHADSIYLFSASPFLLEANHDATETNLTCSYGQTNTDKSYSWIPVEWDPDQVLHGLRCYIRNLAPCGKFVNREGTIAVEMFRVLPDDVPYYGHAFLLMTRIYATDDQPHNRLTYGWVVDWNVPSEVPGVNSSYSDPPYGGMWVRGTEIETGAACQSATSRFASSFGQHGFTDPFVQCTFDISLWGDWHGPREMLDDVESIPDAAAWWNEIGMRPGSHLSESEGDLVSWHTLIYDQALGSADTVYSWLPLQAWYDTDPDDLSWTSGAGRSMIFDALDCTLDCCWGMRGDANGLGGEEPTIGDVSAMIDAKFIAGSCSGIISCLDETDVNGSGGHSTDCDDITIGDIGILIDYLFIGGPAVVELPCCWF